MGVFTFCLNPLCFLSLGSCYIAAVPVRYVDILSLKAHFADKAWGGAVCIHSNYLVPLNSFFEKTFNYWLLFNGP